jgi:hypothetical protein
MPSFSILKQKKSNMMTKHKSEQGGKTQQCSQTAQSPGSSDTASLSHPHGICSVFKTFSYLLAERVSYLLSILLMATGSEVILPLSFSFFFPFFVILLIHSLCA